jgi:hypothetical protein
MSITQKSKDRIFLLVSPAINRYSQFIHQMSKTEAVYIAQKLKNLPRQQAMSRLAVLSRITRKMLTLYVDVINHKQVDDLS